MSATSNSECKASIRNKILSELKAFTKKEEESIKLLDKLYNEIDISLFDAVLAYYPLKTSEPDITPFIKRYNVLLPYIENNEMYFGEGKIL